MKNKLTFLIIFVFIASSPLFALTGSEAAAKIKARLYDAKTISGTVNWQAGENSYTGKFRYLAPGRLRIKLTNPPGKTIVTNGTTLWIFDASAKVCGVQKVDQEKMSSGLISILKYYQGIAIPQGNDFRVELLGKPEQYYKKVSFLTDNQFTPKKITLTTKKDQTVSFLFSNLKFGEKMLPGQFDFNIPSNAQTIKNPLDVR